MIHGCRTGNFWKSQVLLYAIGLITDTADIVDGSKGRLWNTRCGSFHKHEYFLKTLFNLLDVVSFFPIRDKCFHSPMSKE